MNPSTFLKSAACVSLLIGMMSCGSKETPGTGSLPAPPPVEQTKKLSDEESVMAVLFQQQSAEYRALCLQAYHFARLRVDNSLHAKKGNLPLAVITDLDETAIDNSLEYGWEYKNNSTFNPKQWDEWCRSEKADSIPGSVHFFNYADAHKVDIYYVSNRDTSQIAVTMENMKKLGFPQLDRAHFIFKSTKDGSKEGRRQDIAKTHTIILLLGDNLNDFAALYEGKALAERKDAVDKTAAEWGEKFVVLPNAIYGEWENALYDYKHGLSLDQKDSMRVLKLKSF